MVKVLFVCNVNPVTMKNLWLLAVNVEGFAPVVGLKGWLKMQLI